MECKCGCKDFYVKNNGNKTGLYCKSCGEWQKWLNKNEIKKYERIGMKNKNSRGQEFEIIEYNKAIDMKVKFFNGEIAEHITFRDFSDGKVRLPSEKFERHNDRYTKLWKEWNTMLWRCNPKNTRHRKWYFDKNIKVCDEWKKYTNFKSWALSNGYIEGLTIDRIDSNKDYCPTNCRWITMRENIIMSNLKPVIKYDVNGNFIERYNSMKDAYLSIGESSYNNQIRKCCIGEIENYKGFVWKYEN